MTWEKLVRKYLNKNLNNPNINYKSLTLMGLIFVWTKFREFWTFS